MKPPLLQTAWHNRAFFTPQGPRPWHEWFCLGALSPKGDAALWVSFCLFRPANGRDKPRAEVIAQWTTPNGGGSRYLGEAYLADAAGIDPERAGICVGHSMLGDGACAGQLADAAGSLAWQLEIDGRAAPWLPLPVTRLHPHGLGAPALSVPVVAGRARGQVELWDGHGNHRQVQTVRCDGWRVFQWHRWGGPPSAPHALLFAEQPMPAGEPPSRLVAIGTPWRIWPRGSRPIVLARLWHQGELLRFDTWRQLLGSASHINGAAWAFVAAGPAGELTCRVDLPVGAGAARPVEALGGQLLATHQGNLQLDLKRGGHTERLQMAQVACQVVYQQP